MPRWASFDRVCKYLAKHYTTYDSVGNRTKKTENGTATSYTYNGLNQLISESGGGASLTYSYDRNGNQTGITGTAGGSSVSKTYTYTPDNMLATYTDGTVKQENLYAEDLKGSTVNVLDNGASRVVSYWYDDFGEVTESKASGYSGFDNELQYGYIYF